MMLPFGRPYQTGPTSRFWTWICHYVSISPASMSQYKKVLVCAFLGVIASYLFLDTEV